MEQGLRDVDSLSHPVPHSIAYPWTLMHLMSVAELIRQLDEPLGAAKDLWVLHKNAMEEARNGVSIRMGMVVVVGRKPTTT